MPHDVSSQPTAGPADRRPPRRPTFRRGWRDVWLQLHGLIGITAGSVLMIIGLSGATLSFREEILDAVNPGIRHVAARAIPSLTPAQLTAALGRSRPGDRVAQLTMFAEPGAAPRVGLAPVPGRRRGAVLYVDPYSGALRPALRGGDFFEWVESLHRWLLLPREAGKLVAGSLASCLLGMALSGLYLRWPRRVLDWRAWFTFDPTLTGRPFLRGLHACAGTFAMAVYLMSASTGIYWAFDVVKDRVDGWAGVARPAQRPATNRADVAPTDSDPGAAWATFVSHADGWTLAQIRLPERSSQPVTIAWLSTRSPHERARNRMTIAADGTLVADQRYAQLGVGERLLSVVYPLHLGTYFGLVGRIATTAAALCLPLFGVTGWSMYLRRRARRRSTTRRDAMR